MHYRSDNPATDWPETFFVSYRSEAFAEDLDDCAAAPAPAPAAPGWHPLERLLAAIPLLCLLVPVADACLR